MKKQIFSLALLCIAFQLKGSNDLFASGEIERAKILYPTKDDSILKLREERVNIHLKIIEAANIVFNDAPCEAFPSQYMLLELKNIPDHGSREVKRLKKIFIDRESKEECKTKVAKAKEEFLSEINQNAAKDLFPNEKKAINYLKGFHMQLGMIISSPLLNQIVRNHKEIEMLEISKNLVKHIPDYSPAVAQLKEQVLELIDAILDIAADLENQK
ncbi:MAG: hypothetical protein AB7R69_02150 [Candidatus Babeliales bacterium]